MIITIITFYFISLRFGGSRFVEIGFSNVIYTRKSEICHCLDDEFFIRISELRTGYIVFAEPRIVFLKRAYKDPNRCIRS